MTDQHLPSEQRQQRRTAVALGYEPGKDPAPRVLASGKGYIGEKIIELAKANNIPIHEDPLLAGALATLELDETIPAELYQVVAEILAYVYKIRERYKEKLQLAAKIAQTKP